MIQEKLLDEARQVTQIAREASRLAGYLQAWMAQDVATSAGNSMKIATAVRSLAEELLALEGNFERVSETITDATTKWMNGLAINHEEFYWMVSQGLLHCRIGNRDEYDSYMMLHYQDNERCGYIDLQEPPRSSGFITVALRIDNQTKPEDVLVTALRPEQREFFQRELPQVFDRFGKSWQCSSCPS